MTTAQELPALVGSEKQVAWAEQIRAAMLTQAERSLAHAVYADEVHDPSVSERVRARRRKYREEAQRLVDGMRAVTSARWWIDNRSGTWSSLDLLLDRLPASAPAAGAVPVASPPAPPPLAGIDLSGYAAKQLPRRQPKAGETAEQVAGRVGPGGTWKPWEAGEVIPDRGSGKGDRAVRAAGPIFAIDSAGGRQRYQVVYTSPLTPGERAAHDAAGVVADAPERLQRITRGAMESLTPEDRAAYPHMHTREEALVKMDALRAEVGAARDALARAGGPTADAERVADMIDFEKRQMLRRLGRA